MAALQFWYFYLEVPSLLELYPFFMLSGFSPIVVVLISSFAKDIRASFYVGFDCTLSISLFCFVVVFNFSLILLDRSDFFLATDVRNKFVEHREFGRLGDSCFLISLISGPTLETLYSLLKEEVFLQ